MLEWLLKRISKVNGIYARFIQFEKKYAWAFIIIAILGFGLPFSNLPDEIEKETISHYSEENPSDFNKLISQIMDALSTEKQEGEKNEGFESRVIEELKKVLEF